MIEPHDAPVHEQPGIRLRQLRPADAADLLAVASDPAVMRHVGDGRTLSGGEVERWIEKSLENYARHGYGTFALAEPGDDRLFGWAGFVPPGNEPMPEIIYGFAQSHWGLGLGRRVAAALMSLARERFRFDTVLATVDDDHAPSIRILESLGFRLDGVVMEETAAGPVAVRRYLACP